MKVICDKGGRNQWKRCATKGKKTRDGGRQLLHVARSSGEAARVSGGARSRKHLDAIKSELCEDHTGRGERESVKDSDVGVRGCNRSPKKKKKREQSTFPPLQAEESGRLSLSKKKKREIPQHRTSR